MSDAELVIDARGLVRRFGDRVAVDGVDLEVRRGEVFGFLGPNGAGKSTLIRMLVGLLSPSAGNAEVLGLEIPAQAEQLRSRLGYMTQKFSLYDDLSIEENLRFAAEIFGMHGEEATQRVETQLAEYGLAERRQQRPATLSGGWKQRLALAVATVHRPELLFLDEPTAGVDPDSRREFWEKLFELAAAGTTLLVSTHYMDEAVRCHRIGILKSGRWMAIARPMELTEHLAGRVVELRAEPIERALAELRRLPQVLSVTQLGYRVHVLLTEDAPPAAEAAAGLAAALEARGLRSFEAMAEEPNLEDVFVALTQEPAGIEA